VSGTDLNPALEQAHQDQHASTLRGAEQLARQEQRLRILPHLDIAPRRAAASTLVRNMAQVVADVDQPFTCSLRECVDQSVRTAVTVTPAWSD
jgi:hypothetical protein